MFRKSYLFALLAALVLFVGVGGAVAQQPVGTAFTYQGRLTSGGSPVNGTCDIQFSLWRSATTSNTTDLLSPGVPAIPNVVVTNGLFTVRLNFGVSAFNGEARWLEVAVRCPAGVGAFTTLTPRQELTATPYALYAPVAGSANSAFTASRLASGTQSLLFYAGAPEIEQMRITTDGKVGIGTTNPTSPLHIARDSETAVLRIAIQDTNPQNPKMWFLGNDGALGKFGLIDGSYPNYRWIVDSNGNVGIGTTQPAARIHTQAGLFATPNPYVGLDWVSAIFESGAGIGDFIFAAPGNGTYKYGYLKVHGNSDFNRMALGMSDGTTAYEWMTLRDGNVGIGTTSPIDRLDVNGNIHASYNVAASNLVTAGAGVDTGGFVDADGNICAFQGSPSQVCLGILSDARLKANIRPLGNPLDKVEQIRGVYFNWNSEAEPLGYSSQYPQIGVIAQEVEAVFPEAVITLPDGYKAVDYNKLSAVLIEAVKELRAEKDAEIAALKVENAALEQRVGDMEARLSALEQAAGVQGDEARPLTALSSVPPAWLFFGGLFLVSLVATRRWNAKARGRQ